MKDKITSLTKKESTGIINDHFFSSNFAPANNETAINGVTLNGCGIILEITAIKIKPVINQNLELFIVVIYYTNIARK